MKRDNARTSGTAIAPPAAPSLPVRCASGLQQAKGAWAWRGAVSLVGRRLALRGPCSARFLEPRIDICQSAGPSSHRRRVPIIGAAMSEPAAAE